ncbi:MAG: flagellar biosynthesis protein FlhA [Alphaproteobacteria bacterium]|nr:flagellar biosynthesis protein FlhA [Alphaproteobacteria bacterium]
MAVNQGIPNVNMERIQAALSRGDIAFALGLMCILVVLILPLPAWLLDIALAFSLMSSVLVLMTVLFIMKPLEFSSFPTVLLVTTMLRLGLNVASTRLILSRGHEGTHAAGHVIEAFGNFIMGGNFVIGLIVFGILVIVNFVVITKGSGRIAEVSARFSLDSMPGKQMAIDADLSAGLIDETEAKRRRKEVEGESNFYGSMDGAAKFVRGDAIAGLCITFINIVGGIIVGVAQMGVSLSTAAHTYTFLSVGDGLVAQIPALIVSTAAGLLISKAATDEGSANKALFDQLTAYPSALGMASFLMFFISLLPGLPFVPFVMLAGLTGYGAYTIAQKQEKDSLTRITEIDEQEQKVIHDEQEKISQQGALYVEPIRLELGYSLLPLLQNKDLNRSLPDQITALRKQLANEIGFVLPVVRIQDNIQIGSNEYTISIKEIVSAKGDLRPSMLLAMDPQNAEVMIPGEPTKEPTFGLNAKWIDYNRKAEAEGLNYTVVDPCTVIITHLTEVIKDNMVDLLTFEETQKLFDGLSKAHQKLLRDISPAQISMAGIQKVLHTLLQERVSIRDLPTILESIAEACTYSRDISAIAEHVRARLSRQICAANSDENGLLPIITLSPEWEQLFHESLVGEGESRQLAMAPSRLQGFIQKVQSTYNDQMIKGVVPVLLTNPTVRPHVRSVVERFRPSTVVLSQNEIHPRVKLKTCAQIE